MVIEHRVSKALSLMLVSIVVTNVSGQTNSCGFDPSQCTEFEATTKKRYRDGQYFCSPDSKYQMGMTVEGDLCVCNESGKVWCAGTCCEDEGSFMVLQDDGNLVVYNPTRNTDRSSFKSKTAGNQNSSLELTNEGIALLKSEFNEILWTTSEHLESVSKINQTSKSTNISPARSPTVRIDHESMFEEFYEEFISDSMKVTTDESMENSSIPFPTSFDEPEDKIQTQINSSELILIELEDGNNSENISEGRNLCGFNPSECTDFEAIVRKKYQEREYFCSPDSNYQMGITMEGDLCICNESGKVWCAGLCCEDEGAYMIMQRDGNLVVYNPNRNYVDDASFSTKTAGNKFSSLELTNEGAAVLKDTKGKILWTNLGHLDSVLSTGDLSQSTNIGPVQSPTFHIGKESIVEEFDNEDFSDYFNESPDKNHDENVVIVPGTEQILPSSVSSTPGKSKINFVPGQLTVNENGLILSTGLKSRKIAQTGQRVVYHNGKKSPHAFHVLPDAGATFPAPDGGFVYVSNSEDRNQKKGGVGAIRFDKHGNVIDYQMLLTETTANCGGGKTPWNTWVSCEENGQGQIYEVDPFGIHKPMKTAMGGSGGNFESVACDNRNPEQPIFYVTNDKRNGEIRQFTPDPSAVSSGDTWSILSTPGTIKYLKFNKSNKTFSWTSNIEAGKASALENYKNCEGIDFRDGYLYFVSKVMENLYILDLDKMTYEIDNIGKGKFDGKPDQIKRLTSSSNNGINDLLYFTEEGGARAGIHARDKYNNYYTIVEGKKYGKETTGLAFSGDGRYLLFAHQDEGVVFLIEREDGEPFHGSTIDIKRHLAGGRRLNSP